MHWVFLKLKHSKIVEITPSKMQLSLTANGMDEKIPTSRQWGGRQNILWLAEYINSADNTHVL